MPALREQSTQINELQLSERMTSTIEQTPAFIGSHRFNSGFTVAAGRPTRSPQALAALPAVHGLEDRDEHPVSRLCW